MRTRPLAAMVMLSGCWPHLSGEWTDYLDDSDVSGPSVVGAVGVLNATNMVGGYWGNAENFAWAGWAVPAGDVDPSSLVGTCFETGSTPYGPWTGLAFDDAAPIDTPETETRINGPEGKIHLVSESNGFLGNADRMDLDDFVDGFSYDLDPAQINGDEFQITGLFVAPGQYGFQPSLGTMNPPRLSALELSWTWAPTGDADLIEVSAMLARASGTGLESYTCIVPESDGVVAIPSGLWERLDQGDKWFVQLSAIRVVTPEISGPPGQIAVGYAVRSMYGIVVPE